jgi:hypothetical protein
MPVAGDATRYTVKFSNPIVLGNQSLGMGTLHGEFTVTFGDGLGAALGQAKKDKAGSKAQRKQKAPKDCVIA